MDSYPRQPQLPFHVHWSSGRSAEAASRLSAPAIQPPNVDKRKRLCALVVCPLAGVEADCDLPRVGEAVHLLSARPGPEPCVHRAATVGVVVAGHESIQKIQNGAPPKMDPAPGKDSFGKCNHDRVN